MTKNKSEICIITTSLLIVRFFLKPHLNALVEKHNVTLLVNIDDSEKLKSIHLHPAVRTIHIPIYRDISIKNDLKALFLLYKHFANHPYDLIFTVAPKAGFIGMTAAWLRQLKNRVHIFQGEVWVEAQGIKRLILKTVDKLTALFSTHTLVVSESERNFLIEQKIISKSKSLVLGAGSICGVDFSRFKPDLLQRKKIRDLWSIPEDHVLFLFIGRINPDKGVNNLINAFNTLAMTESKIHLGIVGPDEGGLNSSIISRTSNIHCVPTLVDDPESYMAAGDVLVLPSYREGFGLVIIEAAAVGIPSIGTRIYGITDAVSEGQTGVLFEKYNENDLLIKMKSMLDVQYRKNLGNQAKKMCEQKFAQASILSEYKNFFEKLLNEN